MSTALAGSGVQARAPSGIEVMAQIGEENFPVASRLIGSRARRQLIAIYGFARLVDDIGDEAAGDRSTLLDWLETELRDVYAGRTPEHPVMRRLAAAIREHPLPQAPLHRLIEANRVDQKVSRYETFEDLLGYCRLSAAPVGELVLSVFSAADPPRIERSDQICAGLQVIEHLQDIGEDYARGRVYLPRRDLDRFGVGETDLGAGAANQPVRELVAFEAARAAALLDAGAPLARTLGWRARVAVAGFLAGGRAALAGVAQAGYDTLSLPTGRPRRAFLRGWKAAVMGR